MRKTGQSLTLCTARPAFKRDKNGRNWDNRAVSRASTSALAAKVYDGESYRPFGELSAEDADGRAAELRDATGFGPTMRVRPVAQGWRELAALMREREAATVSELDDATIAEFAQRLWVVQPGSSLMQDPKPEPPAGPSGSDQAQGSGS